MGPGRILIMAALLSVADASAQAGGSRRLWTDPPPAVGPAAAAPEAAASEAAPSEASPAGTWPDEAQRRRLPVLSGSAPAESFASAKAAIVTPAAAPAEPAGIEPGPVERIDPRRDGAPKVRPAPRRPVPQPAISDRTRRRLGVLAGFAGAAAAPDADAASVGTRRR